MLESYSEKTVLGICRDFKCSRNSDVEDFLHAKAVTYEKTNRARTYLVMEGSSSLRIHAYFTVALHEMEIGTNVSRTSCHKLMGLHYNKSENVNRTPCYLIGQIARDDLTERRELTGTELLGMALNVIQDAQGSVGGRFVKVDCANIKGIKKFYIENGFSFVKQKENGLLEMVIYF